MVRAPRRRYNGVVPQGTRGGESDQRGRSEAFLPPEPWRVLKASATYKGGSFKSELHRQNSDLQGLRSGIHLDFWGTGVLPVPWTGQRARPMLELSRGTPRRRQHRRFVRRQPWHEWSP